jgi:magnesium transporter
MPAPHIDISRLPAASTVVEFDFATRQERPLSISEARASCESGKSCWIDIDTTDMAGVEALLLSLGVNRVAIDEVLTSQVGGRHDVYEDCLHVSVSAPKLAAGKLDFAHVDIILGERYLVTMHKGRVDFIEIARRNYPHFFQKFAQSLGFLQFELCDQLIESYRRALREIETEVEGVQDSIFGKVDDAIFTRVAEVTHNLLQLRKNVLADRDVLHQLASRRSGFVNESTQPYLANMVGTLDRVGNDLTVERETLAETLDLYLGIVSHRTNRIVNRLTVISAIFLPLTFLCGIYGMNFNTEHDWNMPELNSPYGYLFFWVLVAFIASGALAFIRLKRWW